MSERAHPKLEKVAENTIARFFLQLATPILIGLIAWLGNMQLSSFKDQQTKFSETMEEQTRATSKMASDIRDLNTRFDVIAVRRIDELDRRVERLEQVTKTP